MTSSTWESLPEELLLKIFFYLDAKVTVAITTNEHRKFSIIIGFQDVVKAGQSCRRWQALSSDDILWRKILLRDFRIAELGRLDSVEDKNWRAEYQRLVDNTPNICNEVCIIINNADSPIDMYT